MIPYKPHTDALSQNYKLDSQDNFEDLTILSKTNHVTNNVTNSPAANILNQEHQDYCNWQDQQYIGQKYNGGLERVTIELVDNIIQEEEDGVVNGVTSMINGIINPTHLWKKMK